MHASNAAWLSQRYSCLLFPLGEQAFDFECLSGWSWLIDAALQLIHYRAEAQHLEVQVRQVKEKFGALRIYHHGGDACTDAICDIIERVSENVCEVCGGAGINLPAHKWLSTRCEAHRAAVLDASLSTSRAGYHGHGLAMSICQIVNFFGEPRLAVQWCQTPMMALHGVRPCELLGTLSGRVEITTLLGRLSYGTLP